MFHFPVLSGEDAETGVAASWFSILYFSAEFWAKAWREVCGSELKERVKTTSVMRAMVSST